MKCCKCGEVLNPVSAWYADGKVYCSNCYDKYANEIAGGSQMNVYEVRKKGREYCQTEGSDHYKYDGIEPMDLIIACGYGKGFCIGSIIKYAARFAKTNNPNDLKKIADYAHIMCGILMEGKK